MSKFTAAAVIIILILSCQQKAAQILKSEKIMKNDIEMLYGSIDAEQLYFDYPEWKKLQTAYQPDPAVIKKISELDETFEVKLFLATWCSDCRREVPNFYKIMDVSGLDEKMKISIWAVDRDLDLENNLPALHNLEKVPTFIFYKNSEEIGRIIESPESFLLEEDILQILSKE